MKKVKSLFLFLSLNWKKGLILSAFALGILFSFYHAYYADRIIPGVRVGNISLGGKTVTEALIVLEEPLGKEYTLALIDREKNAIYETKTSEIELQYDPENTVKTAFSVGRSKKFLTDLKVKVVGIIKHQHIKAANDFNTVLLEQRLSQIKGLVDQSAQDAKFYLDEDEILRIQDEQTGRKIGSNKLYQITLESIENLEYLPKELPISTETADVLGTDLKKLETEVGNLVRDSLTVLHEGNAWKITPTEKLEYLEIDLKGDSFYLSLNTKTFESYLEELGKTVNILPRGKVTEETENGQVLGFEIIQEGKELDIKTFTEDFKEALFNGKEMVTVSTIPTDNSSDLTKYGIFALLGRGESDYSGSILPRIHNLTLAAERADGVLVPPGKIFSLSRAIGRINSSTGYDSAWIISGGRTVLGTGGGVCQTSTTMFRAALNSGLPVVERHAHAYRVSYYENDQPIGFDAAIYQPAVDLKFRNDTPNYVLVQTETIPEENKIAFRIYGTPDGREVEITEPIITGVSGAPAPKYEDTDTLAKGVVKQVDFAASGATSVFSRKVTKDGNILFEETYRSVYRPWQAVFLVGTKTD